LRGIMKISARNVLKGVIKRIKPGAVNTEIVVELSTGSEVASIITKESAEKLALEAGKIVYVVIKASDVMIATD
jgi:molybdopterin-binding protein